MVGVVCVAKSRARSNFVVAAVAATVCIIGYQNCSNTMVFEATEDLNSMLANKNYAMATVGDSANFPPLKLVFLVDNSGTMGINQINLSTAFDRMFAGSNVNNLAPFETTAYIVNTSQYSPEKSEPVFPRLPTDTVESFSLLDAAQFAVHRGAKLSGRIPGDLVGYGTTSRVEPERSLIEFRPAPVALFNDNGAGGKVVSYGSHKPRNGSVAEFSSDFKARLALLNPDLSEIDPGTKKGVLDDVIDKESGLCALARVLRFNEGFVKPGDMASVVVVSDENDADPSGRACLDALIESKSGSMYVDGHCDMPQTSLTYRQAIPNPSKAKCRVDYTTGFSYLLNYKYPTTNVNYYTSSMTYDQLRTNVSYYTVRYTYDQLRTSVSYYTSRQIYDKIETPVAYFKKAPTYDIPRTSVKYYVEVEDCTIRDGAPTNCTYTYPDSTVILNGAFNNNCDGFVAGRLPSGALYNKAGYKPICTTAAPSPQVGPCSATDPNIINCRQNYSGPMTLNLPGKVTSTCAAFTAGKLPSGAIYTGTDAGYDPSCGTLIRTPNVVGACTAGDPDKENCRPDYVAAPTPVLLNGIRGTTACETWVSGRLPAGAVYNVPGYLPTCNAAPPVVGVTGACSTSDPNVANCQPNYTGPLTMTLNGIVGGGGCQATFGSSLPSNTVVGDTGRPITCTAGTPIIGVSGTCSPTNTNIANCQTVYSPVRSTTLDGEPSGGNCAAFVSGRLPAGAVYTTSGYLPECTGPGTPRDASPVTGSLNYTSYPTETFTAGAACSTAVRNSIISARGLVVASSTTPTCSITSLTASNQILTNADPNQGLTCAVAQWADVCTSSGGARRGCAPTDIPAGEPYNPTPTTVTYEGSFTCSTMCSNTTFCKTLPGTVGANYYACATAPAAAAIKSSFVLEPENSTTTCPVPQMRVVTRGPYQTTENGKSYVAGTRSQNNEPNALIDYIMERSQEIFQASTPIVSVFVRQSGDPLGVNGSLGTAYNQLADRLGGKKRSVLAGPDEYASALEDLSSEIRERLGRSFNFKEITEEFQVRKVWFRKAGATEWGAPLDRSMWSASGATILIDQAVGLEYGDQLYVEYW